MSGPKPELCQCGRPRNSRGKVCCQMCEASWPAYGLRAQHTKRCKRANGPAYPLKSPPPAGTW